MLSINWCFPIEALTNDMESSGIGGLVAASAKELWFGTRNLPWVRKFRSTLCYALAARMARLGPLLADSLAKFA